MTPENFIFWLNGFLEIAQPETISKQQILIIKDHVALVLKKETPHRNTDADIFTLSEAQKRDIYCGTQDSIGNVKFISPCGSC